MGKYIIPITYAVCSTVVVEGANSLTEARDIVEKHLDEIPLPAEENCNYVDDSYRIDADTDEDLETAQNYNTRGVLLTKYDDGNISYLRL